MTFPLHELEAVLYSYFNENVSFFLHSFYSCYVSEQLLKCLS